MRAQMYHRAPSMSLSIASAMVVHPNYPFVLSSSRISEGSVFDDDFTFNISNDLLLNPNDVVVGEMIAEGSSSIVRKGLFKNQLPVAVKVMQPSRSFALSRECKENFQKEVLLLSKMKHDNIVKFVGACIEPQLMIVTELLEGGTLHHLLFNALPYRLDLKVSLRFALDIARAMEYMHSNGIIHRDLKPNNILLTNDLTKVKLIDLGVAREETTDGMTNEAGNFRYMAPEAYNIDPRNVGGNLNYDHKIDVYSFAIVFWQMLTGKIPFRGKHYNQIPLFAKQNVRPSLKDIPDGAVSILEACWAQDPKSRPEFKEITVLLADLLNKYLSSNDTSSDTTSSSRLGNIINVKDDFMTRDTATSSMQANLPAMEDLRNGVLTQESNSHVMKPKGKNEKKTLLKRILPVIKIFGACLSK